MFRPQSWCRDDGHSECHGEYLSGHPQSSFRNIVLNDSLLEDFKDGVPCVFLHVVGEVAENRVDGILQALCALDQRRLVPIGPERYQRDSGPVVALLVAVLANGRALLQPDRTLATCRASPQGNRCAAAPVCTTKKSGDLSSLFSRYHNNTVSCPLSTVVCSETWNDILYCLQKILRFCYF